MSIRLWPAGALVKVTCRLSVILITTIGVLFKGLRANTPLIFVHLRAVVLSSKHVCCLISQYFGS